MGKTRDLFKKIRYSKGTFHAKMGTIKDRNDRDLTKAEDIKERYKHLNAEFQRLVRRSKKAFLSDQCKAAEENNRMGKTLEISSRKLEIPSEIFMQRWAQ